MNNLLIKPTGPNCNLSCKYCFYLEKENIYPGKNRMDLATAENMISQLMKSGKPAFFSWQGGEPALMGLDFFKEVIELQKKHGSGGQRVTNTIQTNGTLIDNDWAKFFSRYNFLVGLSLDGPKDLHDANRTYSDGEGSFEEVMEAAEILGEHEVPFNVLAVLNSRTVKQPKRILNFFLQNNLTHIQFIPAVETVKSENGEKQAPFSPDSEAVGKFLDEVFQAWTKNFPPEFSVRYFESLVNTKLGGDPAMCKIDATCGSYLVVEHNGDVYPCDFFVEEDWRLGNLNEKPLGKIQSGDKFRKFAEGKIELSEECKGCDYLPYCYGGCQRYRGMPEGAEGRSYLCDAYRYFLSRNLAEIDKIASRFKKERIGGKRQFQKR